jgi:hypothetical protein
MTPLGRSLATLALVLVALFAADAIHDLRVEVAQLQVQRDEDATAIAEQIVQLNREVFHVPTITQAPTGSNQ